MDIYLLEFKGHVIINPCSIHGILWLQTHFKAENWDAILGKNALIPLNEAKCLIKDAHEAGLTVNLIPALTKAEKFK